MPPESPRPENNDSPEEYLRLTDQNVAILYQIIKFAEQYPDVETQPFRAVFAAYDTVLPENGLEPDHDQIYLRFLFKLGDRREEGHSLYESFETLLERLGIQIEFNTEEDGIQEVTRNVSEEGYGQDDNDPQENPNGAHSRSRRASSNSLYDAEDESTRAMRPRAGSRASMSQLQVSQPAAQENRPSTRATTRRTEKTATIVSSSRKPAQQIGRGRLTAQEFANNLQHDQLRNASASSRSRRKGPRIPGMPAHSIPTGARGIFSQSSSDLGNEAVETSATSQDFQQQLTLNRQDRFYQPSKTQLLRDAATFHNFRIRSVARDVVDKWCYAALEARDTHQHMERVAAAHDTRILLQQAFENWRLRLHEKKQAAETERHFNHLERRTDKARDLYLLTKAFTHWSQCASDEVLRTSAARQHILSIKYFHAWRDITASNLHKVHHQGLRKFFGFWKHRYARSLTDGIKADLFHQNSLTQNGYWVWFWAFCERRAPEWRARKLRQKHLLHLVAAFRDIRQRERLITNHVNEKEKQKVLSHWVEKARVQLSSQREATLFNHRMLTNNALQRWSRSWQYAPLARQISNVVDWRVAGVTFATVVNRYRTEEQAANINRLRISRATWTQWNDRLRWQTLARRIDDRYLLEALYKWVIAERYVLLQRLSNQRLKHRFLAKLKDNCSLRIARRDEMCQIVGDGRRLRCLHSVTQHWRSQLSSERQRKQIAFEFHAPIATQEALNLWLGRSKHLHKLGEWSKDAAFYFVAQRHLKRWHTASIESKREKRRQAYQQTRRKSKMNLAAGILQRWRILNLEVHNLQQEASTFDRDRLLKVGTTLFDHWRSRFNLTLDQEDQAIECYEKRLLHQCLHAWVDGLNRQARVEQIANLNNVMRVKNVASGWLHNSRLRIIELKGQEANADRLRTWYEKRHAHGLIRDWRDKTAKRLNRPQHRITFTSRARRTRLQVEERNPLGQTSRAEDWTDFDMGDWIPALEAQSSTTPLPGYLSTPSKRAARAKALVGASTTPLGTPFQNRLRSQLNATPRTTRRGAFSRSTALRESTFGAIMEESRRTPGIERDE